MRPFVILLLRFRGTQTAVSSFSSLSFRCIRKISYLFVIRQSTDQKVRSHVERHNVNKIMHFVDQQGCCETASRKQQLGGRTDRQQVSSSCTGAEAVVYSQILALTLLHPRRAGRHVSALLLFSFLSLQHPVLGLRSLFVLPLH